MSRNKLLKSVTENLLTEGSCAKSSDAVNNVVYGVLAPTLNSYVVWVLKNVMEKGIRRLYFLARDGYLMYRTARKYAETFHLNIDCRYLYCSRYSVRVPSYYRDIDKALEYITLGGLDVTPTKIFARAGLTGEQKEKLLSARIIDKDPEEQIPRSELSNVRIQLGNSKLFIQELMEISRKAEPALFGYLKQEGLLEDIPMAFVDSGWVGSMQQDLNEVLCRMGRTHRIEGYYFGLYEVPVRRELFLYHTWFFSPENNLQRKVLFNNCLFEALFTAPHGMTLGYEYQNGRFRPILDNISENRAVTLKNAEQMYSQWQDELLKNNNIHTFEDLLEQIVNPTTDQIIEANLSLFMHHPTREEAELYGHLEFTDDILEYGGNQIAARMSEEDLKNNHLIGRITVELIRKQHVRQSGWYEGSAVLYSQNPEYHIFAYSFYKRMMYIRKKQIWKKRNK